MRSSSFSPRVVSLNPSLLLPQFIILTTQQSCFIAFILRFSFAAVLIWFHSFMVT